MRFPSATSTCAVCIAGSRISTTSWSAGQWRRSWKFRSLECQTVEATTSWRRSWRCRHGHGDSLPEEHFLKKIENVMQDSDEEYENMTEEERRHLIRTGMSDEERCQLKAWVSAAYPDLKRQHEEQPEEYMPVYADPKMQQEHLEMKKRLLPP